MKIREALKAMQLRLTELEEYLNISRPTLYKYVEYYESGKQNLINPVVKDLFKYIEKNKSLTKKEAISYIANLGKGGLEENSITFSLKPTDQQREFLLLVQTYINKTYDSNNYSKELGKLLLLISDINSKRELTEQENAKIKNIIQGEEKQ